MKILNQYYSEPQKIRFERTEDGFLRLHARVLREGVMPYSRDELSDIPPECTADPIMMYVSMDSLSSGDALRSLEGSAFVAGGHRWITPENANEAQGHTAGTPKIEGPFLETDFLVTDPEAIRRIESGELSEISAAYHAQSIFEPGDFDGQHFDARQAELRFNHSSALQVGHGRAGQDIRILNQKSKGFKAMADEALVKVRLPRTGRYIFTNEAGAKDIEEERVKNEEVDDGHAEDGKKKDASIEEKMSDHEDLKKENEELKKQLEESAGELSVIKQKLDELLSDESVEKKAEEMNEEQGDADDIIENSEVKDEDGKEMDEKKKEEFRNSLRKVHGQKLHASVLKAVGIKIENMSPDALKGAFRAAKAMSGKGGPRNVAGHNMMIQNQTTSQVGGKAAHDAAMHRLGYRSANGN